MQVGLFRLINERGGTDAIGFGEAAITEVVVNGRIGIRGGGKQGGGFASGYLI